MSYHFVIQSVKVTAWTSTHCLFAVEVLKTEQSVSVTQRASYAHFIWRQNDAVLQRKLILLWFKILSRTASLLRNIKWAWKDLSQTITGSSVLKTISTANTQCTPIQAIIVTDCIRKKIGEAGIWWSNHCYCLSSVWNMVGILAETCIMNITFVFLFVWFTLSFSFLIIIYNFINSNLKEYLAERLSWEEMESVARVQILDKATFHYQFLSLRKAWIICISPLSLSGTHI